MPAIKKSDIEFDKGLFKQIKRGNEDALEILFKKYYQQLCLYVQTYVRLPQLSEDIVTDLFTDIWIKRRRINITDNLRSYLYISAKNAALTYLRKKKLDTVSLDDALLNPFEYRHEPVDNVEQDQMNSAINQILKEIPPRSLQVFILHRFEEMKYSEIAELLQISIKTVGNHMSLAIKVIDKNKDIILKHCM